MKAYSADLPVSETFTYLDSIVRKHGGVVDYIMNRLNKAKNIMRMLNNTRKSSKYSNKTKLRISNSVTVLQLQPSSKVP